MNSKTIYAGKNFEHIEIKEGGVGNFGDTHKVPSQLSSKLGKSTIIGRKKELEDIDNLLKSNNSLLLINGIGGVGKSTIASYYLHSKKDEFDYYGFFEGLESFANELKARLNLKSEKPNELFLEALTKLSTLEGNKLLVLDDVKNIEENQKDIDKILDLKHSSYKILITSREEIEGDIYQYYLDVLSKEDAKVLFNSIYKVEDEKLLEEILEYLDYHAFFIEKTAHSIKKTVTPETVRDKFKSGEFSKISVKRKQNFNKFLNQLFTLDNLDSEEILMLKQFSALPSIEINFESLEYIFQKKDNIEFEELLDFLSEKGWLSKLEGGYKLHQIIKEYIISNYPLTFEEIEIVVDTLKYLTRNSTDAQVAVDNRENIIYFESLVNLLERLEIENEKVGVFFNNFGNIYRHLGLYYKAEPLYLKVLKIFKEVLGEEHHDIASSYNNLAGIYESMGEYKKAEYFYLKSLEIVEKVLGEEYLLIATICNNLAGLYKLRKKYQRAEILFLKSLKIVEKVLGEKNLYTISSYNNLATFYDSMGEYKKAEPLYLKALKIREKVLGEEHPSTATSYNNLAELYRNMGEYKKAEPLYLKALKIREEVLGEEHPDTAQSYNNLAIFYYGQGDYENAYNYMKRAVEVWSKVLPSNHPDLINSKKGLEIIEQKLLFG